MNSVSYVDCVWKLDAQHHLKCRISTVASSSAFEGVLDLHIIYMFQSGSLTFSELIDQKD